MDVTNEHKGTVRVEEVRADPSKMAIRCEALRLGVSRANEDGGDALAYARRFLDFINDNEAGDVTRPAERSGPWWVFADFRTARQALSVEERAGVDEAVRRLVTGH